MNIDEINLVKIKVLEDAIQSLKLTLELNLVGGKFFQSQIKETLEIIEGEYNNRVNSYEH